MSYQSTDTMEVTLDTLRECLENENHKKKLLDYHHLITVHTYRDSFAAAIEKLVNPCPITIVYTDNIENIIAEMDSLEFEYYRNGRTHQFHPRHIVTHVVIDSSVTSLPNQAFCFWYSLKTVSFEETSSLKTIGDHAFCACSSLNYVKLPPSVISVGVGAFKRCYSLKQIELPRSLQLIKDGAFVFCISLSAIAIPSLQPTIHSYTFASCRSLKHVDIPPSVTSIDRRAFRQCTSLTSVILPPSVASISEGAFHNCKNLRAIYVPSTDNINIQARASFDKDLILLVNNDVSNKNVLEPILSLQGIHDCLDLIPTNVETTAQMDFLSSQFDRISPDSSKGARDHRLNLLHLLVQFPSNSTTNRISSRRNVNVLDIISTLLQKCPEAFRSVDENDQTPLHQLLTLTNNGRRDPLMVQMLMEYCDSRVLHLSILSKSASWDVIEHIAKENIELLSEADEENGLVAFMIAGAGKNSNLTHTYQLLQMKPDVLLNLR